MKENCSLTGALFTALFFCPRHFHLITNFPTGSTVVHILIIVFVPSTHRLMWWQSWRDTDEGHWGDEGETGAPRVQIHAELLLNHFETGRSMLEPGLCSLLCSRQGLYGQIWFSFQPTWRIVKRKAEKTRLVADDISIPKRTYVSWCRLVPVAFDWMNY